MMLQIVTLHVLKQNIIIVFTILNRIKRFLFQGINSHKPVSMSQVWNRLVERVFYFYIVQCIQCSYIYIKNNRRTYAFQISSVFFFFCK